MQSKSLPPTIRPGIVNIAGRDPKTQRVAESLLEEDREKHHCIWEPKEGFHNHLSHHLLVAYDLGAPASVLQALYDAESVSQQPIDSQGGPSDQLKITPDNFGDHVGQHENYHAFLTFFTNQIKESGVSNTLENYIFSPSANVKGLEMLARFMSGLYHPMIQTGYGAEFGSDAMVAQGLAQASIHSPLVSELLDYAELGMGDLSKTQKREVSEGKPLFQVFRELYDSEILKPVTYVPAESVKYYREVTMKDGRPEEIRRLCSTWWGNGSLEQQVSTVDEKLEELFWMATLLLVGTGKRERQPRLDFTLVHALDATLFLPSLLKVIPNDSSKVKLLKALLPVTMMYAIVRGRPRIDAGLMMSYTDVPRPPKVPPVDLAPNEGAIGNPNDAYNPWFNILASVIHAPDPHTLKAIRTLYYAAQHYGHKKVIDLPGCFLDKDRQKETLPGISGLDGTVFVRAAGVVMNVLGWVTHGDKAGQWDFSGLGWDEAWKNDD